MKKYQELAYRYVTRRKSRSAMVICSMVLATILIYVVITMAVGGILNEYQTTLTNGNYYLEYVKLSDEQTQMLRDHVNVESVVRGGRLWDELPEVRRDAAVIDYRIRIKEAYDIYMDYNIQCLDSFDQDIFTIPLRDGRYPENDKEIILSDVTTKCFPYDVKVGDKIHVDFEADYSGSEDTQKFTREYTVVGICEIQGDMVDYPTLYTLSVHPEQQTTYVRLVRKFHMDQDGRKLAELVNAPFNDFGRRYSKGAMSVFYLQDEFTVVMGVAVLMMALLFIYFCSLIIRSLMSTNLINKIKDYVVLKSMGATNKQLRQIMMRENLVDGCVAYVVGIALGQLIYMGFGQLAETAGQSPVTVLIALGLSALFLWGTIEWAAAEPYFKMKKLSIVETLGNNGDIKPPKKRKRESFLYRNMHIEGQYAVKSMKRNRKGFWNAVAAFSASVMVITILATVIYNLNISLSDITELDGMSSGRKLNYDIVCNVSAEPYEDIADVLQAIRDREYVKKAEPHCSIVLMQDQTNGLRITKEVSERLEIDEGVNPCLTVLFMTKEQLNALNPYMENGTDAYEATKNGGVIALGTTTIGRKEVPLFDVKPGDQFLMTPLAEYKKAMQAVEKSEEEIGYLMELNKNMVYEPYTITGICRDNPELDTYSIYTVIMAYDYAKEICGEEYLDLETDNIYVQVDSKKFDVLDFDELVTVHPLLISWRYTDTKKIIADYTSGFRYAAIFIIVFVTLLGIVNVLNTMVNDQIQRQKENAILRAIGMSRNALNRMLVTEKMIVGLISWLTGTVLAIPLSWIFTAAIVDILDEKFKIPWYICIVTAVFMIVIMGALSFVMIQLSGKMQVSDGIRNEE